MKTADRMGKISMAIVLGLLMIVAGCYGHPEPNKTNQSLKGSSQSVPRKERKFSLKELKKYNGQNGKPAYVAVNGTVYDVTDAPWRDGLQIMKKFTVVGVLKE